MNVEKYIQKKLTTTNFDAWLDANREQFADFTTGSRTAPTTHTLPKRRSSKKVKIAATAAACVALAIAVGAVGTFFGLSGLNGGVRLENLDRAVVNLSNYTAIGIASGNFAPQTGTAKAVSLSSNRIVASTAETETKRRLVGMDATGAVEPIKYKKDGEEIVPETYLTNFAQTKQYMFVNYSTTDNPRNGANFYSDEANVTYVIDKETGETYQLKFEESSSMCAESAFILDEFYGNSYGISSYDCGAFVIMNVVIDKASDAFYKVGTENGLLKVEEFISLGSIPGFVSVALGDLYGNIIIARDRDGEAVFQVMDPQGTIHTTDIGSNFYKSLDGYIYNGNQKLNEKGEFEDVDWVPDRVIVRSEDLIYSSKNADYYFQTNENSAWPFSTQVVKVVKDGERFSFEYIDIGTTNFSKFAVSNANVFSVKDDNVIIRLDMKSGTLTEIPLRENIVLESIALYNTDAIEFSGTDLTFQQVHGIISSNGEVSYEYTAPPSLKCYYFQPLKRN